MSSMFTYDTIPKQTMGRKGKQLNPEEKRVVINNLESGISTTEIGILLKKDHIVLWVLLLNVICWEAN